MKKAGTILIYNCNGPEFSKMRQIFAMLRLLMRPITPEKYDIPLIELVKGTGTLNPESTEPFKENMLVFCGMNPALLHQVREVLRLAKLPTIHFSAVLTEQNFTWNSRQLHEDMQKNRDELIVKHQAELEAKGLVFDSFDSKERVEARAKAEAEAKAAQEAKAAEAVKAAEEAKAAEAIKDAEETKAAEAVKAAEDTKAAEAVKAAEDTKAAEESKAAEIEEKPAPKRRTARAKAETAEGEEKPAPKRRTAKAKAETAEGEEKPAPKRRTAKAEGEEKPAPKRRTTKAKAAEENSEK